MTAGKKENGVLEIKDNGLVLLVADPSRVLKYVAWLRNQTENVLVASLPRDFWMIPVCQVVVATIDEATEICINSRQKVKTVVLDPTVSASALPKLSAHLIKEFATARLKPNKEVTTSCEYPPFCLPEDEYFSGMRSFSRRPRVGCDLHDVVQQDCSCIMAFVLVMLQGLCSASASSRGVIVTCDDRVEHTVEWIRALINYLGLSFICSGDDEESEADIIVVTPTKMSESDAFRWVVLADADRFLQAGPALFERLPRGAQWGVHSESMNEEIINIVRNPSLYPRAEFGIQLKVHFFAMVDEDKKLDLIVELWKTRICIPLYRVAICCASPESVEWYARELELRGLPSVYALHSNLDEEELTERRKAADRNGKVWVTDVDCGDVGEVLYVEVPRTQEAYYSLVGHKYISRQVYFFCSGDGDVQVLQALQQKYGLELRPTQLPQGWSHFLRE